MSPEHQLLNVPCLCVGCVSVWSWSALQFAPQDLKIVMIWQILRAPTFCIVLYCMPQECVYPRKASLWFVARTGRLGGACPGLGQPGYQVRGEGSIEPPKTGGGGGWEKGSIDRTINQSL